MIDRSSQLEYFLPSVKGKGQLSLRLIHYLIGLQNKIVNKSCKIMKTVPKSIKVDGSITPADVINVTPDRDVESLILSTSCYELDLTTKKYNIRFDFNSLRLQIISLWAEGVPSLTIGKLPELECKGDMKLKTRLKQLCVKQEKLTPVISKQISVGCNQIEEVFECLSYLNIAVGYLTTIEMKPDEKLIDFLENLGLPNKFFPPIARKSCLVENIEDLWHILHRRYQEMLIDHNLFHTPESANITAEEIESIKQSVKGKPQVMDLIADYLHRLIYEFNDQDFLNLP